jgi:hypothetical protein
MKQLRISATEIDQYRDYCADKIDFETLLRRLRHEEPPSVNMQAGTAWHAIMETAVPCEGDTFERDGFVFKVECDDQIELPRVRELKGVKTYTVGDVEVTLVGKVDGIGGLAAIDYKLTARPDMGRLMYAYQWRVYMEVFDLYCFVYIVCTAKDLAVNPVVITDIDELTAYRYPEIGDDVRKAVECFTDFCTNYLPERISA